MLPTLAAAQACDTGPATAAVANAASLRSLVWAPYGRAEQGWEIYYPRLANELRTSCGPATLEFAARLATWQRDHALAPTGIIDEPTFEAISALWQSRRPYVALRGKGECPPPPPRVLEASPGERYLGKPISARARALGAYRAMVAEARRALPELRRDPRWLSIFSGFRDPAADAARCERDGNCDGVARAKCSAHRTGLAFDLYVGQAPGYGPDSSKDPNRLAMTRTAAYRWLVANAHHYKFVNYAFEPWHWEWTGEAP